jgi:hypothetical protein
VITSIFPWGEKHWGWKPMLSLGGPEQTLFSRRVRPSLAECLAKQHGEERGALHHAGTRRVEIAVVDMVIGRKPSTPSIAGRYAHGMLHVADSHTP